MQTQYKYGDRVFLHKLKLPGTYITIDDDLALVEYVDGIKMTKAKFNLGEISLYDENYKANKLANNVEDIIYCAKIREDAKLLDKRDEDGAYDIYASFEDDELYLPKDKPTLVTTGIATAFSSKYRLNVKHERGSTGLYAMSVLSGIVDSGYRGEIKINITPLYKDIVISKTFDFPMNDKGKLQVVELDNKFIYPYENAIAQGTLEEVPIVIIKETTLDHLQSIPSVRGKDGYGSTNK